MQEYLLKTARGSLFARCEDGVHRSLRKYNCHHIVVAAQKVCRHATISRELLPRLICSHMS
eukprot:1417917-Amphidinium_carterae.1